MLRRFYRPGKPIHWDIIEKETIDEIIFKTAEARNRLILELMARGRMKVGEAQKVTPRDVNDSKLTTQTPKSGKDAEAAFVPRKEADRRRRYVEDTGIEPGQRRAEEIPVPAGSKKESTQNCPQIS